MFGEPGRFYVYLIYGKYFMLNVVTNNSGIPSAVLIRSVATVTGPGRLTRELNITKKYNTQNADRERGMWFEDRGVKVAKKNIKQTPRIGVDYAGPVWSQKLWRYIYTPD